MSTPTSQAVEKADTSPRAMVAQYSDSFAAVLPSHIKPETWVRLAQGALKKGKRVGNQYELEVAAANNIPLFLSTLLDAARLGLEPGTEEYYLTPRKTKGKLEILGIVGYQGIVELMYRAGAISTVLAECVYTNDHFEYAPGRHERPIHEIDWDLPDRGELRLVYAYAIMKDGATSKVVVMNRASIARIKAKAQGSDSQYSPWNTDEPAMWLKSAVRQLRKWVPTSAEYIREQMRAAQDVAAEGEGRGVLGAPDLPATDGEGAWDADDDEVVDAEVVETVVVDGREGAWDADDDEVVDAEVVETVVVDGREVVASDDPPSQGQMRKLMALLGPLVDGDDARHAWAADKLGRPVGSFTELSADDVHRLIDELVPA